MLPSQSACPNNLRSWTPVSRLSGGGVELSLEFTLRSDKQRVALTVRMTRTAINPGFGHLEGAYPVQHSRECRTKALSCFSSATNTG